MALCFCFDGAAGFKHSLYANATYSSISALCIAKNTLDESVYTTLLRKGAVNDMTCILRDVHMLLDICATAFAAFSLVA